MSFSKPPNGFGGRHCKQCISPFCQRHPPVIQGHGLSQSGCQQQLILSKRMKFRMGMSWQKAVLGSKGKIILLLMQRYIYTYKKRNANHLKLPTIKAFSYHSPDRGRRLNTNPITCQLRYWLSRCLFRRDYSQNVFCEGLSTTHHMTDLRIPKICPSALLLHPSGGKAGKRFSHLQFNEWSICNGLLTMQTEVFVKIWVWNISRTIFCQFK